MTISEYIIYHHCTQTLVLAVFIAEVFSVLVRQTSHVQVTRALRPVFFLDNVLMDGVRRYICSDVTKLT